MRLLDNPFLHLLVCVREPLTDYLIVNSLPHILLYRIGLYMDNFFKRSTVFLTVINEMWMLGGEKDFVRSLDSLKHQFKPIGRSFQFTQSHKLRKNSLFLKDNNLKFNLWKKKIKMKLKAFITVIAIMIWL